MEIKIIKEINIKEFEEAYNKAKPMYATASAKVMYFGPVAEIAAAFNKPLLKAFAIRSAISTRYLVEIVFDEPAHIINPPEIVVYQYPAVIGVLEFTGPNTAVFRIFKEKLVGDGAWDIGIYPLPEEFRGR